MPQTGHAGRLSHATCPLLPSSAQLSAVPGAHGPRFDLARSCRVQPSSPPRSAHAVFGSTWPAPAQFSPALRHARRPAEFSPALRHARRTRYSGRAALSSALEFKLLLRHCSETVGVTSSAVNHQSRSIGPRSPVLGSLPAQPAPARPATCSLLTVTRRRVHPDGVSLARVRPTKLHRWGSGRTWFRSQFGPDWEIWQGAGGSAQLG